MLVIVTWSSLSALTPADMQMLGSGGLSGSVSWHTRSFNPGPGLNSDMVAIENGVLYGVVCGFGS